MKYMEAQTDFERLRFIHRLSRVYCCGIIVLLYIATESANMSRKREVLECFSGFIYLFVVQIYNVSTECKYTTTVTIVV